MFWTDRGEFKVTLSIAKSRFAGEWIAFQFSDPEAKVGRVLRHDKERSGLFKKLPRGRIPSGVYVTFAGPVLPKDVGIVLFFEP